MLEKIHLVQERIAQLEEILERARTGKGYADIKWTQSLLDLNKKVLTQLMQGLPIEFYKVQYTNENAKGFFLTKADIVEPFMNVWN